MGQASDGGGDNYAMAESVLDIEVTPYGEAYDRSRFYRSEGAHSIVQVSAKAHTILVQAAAYFPGMFEARARRVHMTTRRHMSTADLIGLLAKRMGVGDYGVYQLFIRGEVTLRAAHRHPRTRSRTPDELFSEYVHVVTRGYSTWFGVTVPTEYARGGHLHGEAADRSVGGHLVKVHANAEVLALGAGPDYIYEEAY